MRTGISGWQRKKRKKNGDEGMGDGVVGTKQKRETGTRRRRDERRATQETEMGGLMFKKAKVVKREGLEEDGRSRSHIAPSKRRETGESRSPNGKT